MTDPENIGTKTFPKHKNTQKPYVSVCFFRFVPDLDVIFAAKEALKHTEKKE